ncbi:MAG: hypothetical protein ACOVP2_04725 [Armatimonadaceae bacterium]
MDGVFPFLILILVIGASVGIAIGMSAIMSRWERSVPKPGMSDFMDISKSLAPDLTPSKVFVLDSASTTFTRSWFIRDAVTDNVIANVEYEMNGDIILKMKSGERYFIENTEPPHRVSALRHSIDGGFGKAILVRRGGTLRNADAKYQLADSQAEIAITPKIRPLFPKKLVLTDPNSGKPIATIAWLGSLTPGPFYMAAAGDLSDAIGAYGCCAVLILESRRFF